ncbi:MAG: DUF4350 domain-containing protein, partial [Pontibacter sp.]|nr:DUF4350 domain-containing protein [Pontibacter sp.]
QQNQQTYTFPRNNNAHYLVPDSEASYTVLGRYKAGKLNFISIPFGKGRFYINSVPLAFTNYQLLTLNQSAYAATALSHLPVQPVLWDEYQKQGRLDDQSILRVLMGHEALTWAYYLALLGMVLFLLFQSKRNQRVIPVVAPPRNTTLDFVKAISSLYFNKGNHKNIAEKKIAFFLEHLRLRYHIPTGNFNEELRERVISKSGADGELVENIFMLADSIWQSSAISDQTLMLLNNYLEDFYRQTALRPQAKV